MLASSQPKYMDNPVMNKASPMKKNIKVAKPKTTTSIIKAMTPTDISICGK
ncbi:hypothetical protein FM109_04075 [Vibrio casei]|nr:hypothetical protein FM109_04075 [Vibrio casei]